MGKNAFQVVVVSGVVTAAVVGVGPFLRDGQPKYLTVGQIVAEPMRWQGDSVSVVGAVQPGSRQRFGAEWRFNVVSRGQSLRVRYTGVAPNTFTDGSEVLLIGELRDGEFSAGNLLVKVPG